MGLLARRPGRRDIRRMVDDRTKEYEILRALTPEQKVATMQGLLQLAYDLKVAWLRAEHPEMEESEVRRSLTLVTGGPA